ncbi:ferritin-like domain-containing protein [Nitrogeniibacter mangrovi]|uniref:Ferritin-like domain-containing protein n=1 Tax=Nitrogeniibacter mangrovi TaxID=2016596 RepID=A0A6C1B6S2_9RHOO|nr:ferritin-like domain-containing protein [Nitrogeniibacter mangrovi]QID18505.1 ferritin-like domain-containing protein [Nitrogeniibacter mangrovi]
MGASIHAAARAALQACDPAHKCALVAALKADADAGRLGPCPDEAPLPIGEPGRPPRPVLIDPAAVPDRRPSAENGHAALLHAIAHIEFNAINLALDCVYRFRDLPEDFYTGWVDVAAEEARHFGLVCDCLAAAGAAYGDFPAHNGLWEMTVKTAHDPLARMALVPRVLEARGLDATPPIMARLRRSGDTRTLAVLDIILRDEIGHVALGDRWFRHFCAQRGLEPEAQYRALIDAFDAPWPRPPLNRPARRRAGFSEQELDRLERPRRR